MNEGRIELALGRDNEKQVTRKEKVGGNHSMRTIVTLLCPFLYSVSS